MTRSSVSLAKRTARQSPMSFSTPAAFRKAQREVEEFHRFQTVSADLIAVNEKICRLRPAEPEQGAWTPQEKNGC